MHTNNESSNPILDAALAYARDGWAVIPLSGKVPMTRHGYKEATKDPEQIRYWWNIWPEANVGLVTGQISGRLVLDIDVKKGHRGDQSLQELEEQYGALPITLKSRTASGGWHYVFRMPDRLIKSRKGVRDGVDLLAERSYFVAPPSEVHGTVYEWIVESEAVLCPEWVANLRKGKTGGDGGSGIRIPQLIRTLFPDGKESNGYWMTLCPFHDDRDPSLSITLKSGDFRCFACPAEGTIIELYAKVKDVSEGEARDIVFPAPEYVHRLNQRHAVVSLEGDEVILNEKYNRAGNYLGVNFSSPTDLTLKYENDRVSVAWKRGNVSIAEAWRRHPRRRQYNEVIFEPGLPDEPGSFNLWKGFAVEPDPDTSKCQIYLAHLYENICRGNKQHYDYLLAWMANTVQQPRNKPGIAVVLRGRQGTGKSIACEEFGSLVGIHFVTVAQPSQLLGKFNIHLKQALVVLAEEAFWAGDKSSEGVLKDLITGSQLKVEPKGKDVFFVANHLRFLICSNHDWVIPAGQEERRFFVLEVGDGKKQNDQYFGEVLKQMNAGGRGALLHYLLHYDYSNIHLRRVPHTDALQDNKLHSMSTVMMFIYEALENGRWCRHHEEWRQSVACREVHAAYVDYACRVGQSRKSSETELGKALRKILPDVRKRQTVMSEGRINVWDFPDLITCRKYFDELMNWPGHEWSLPETAPAQEWKAEDFEKLWPDR